MSGNQPTNRNIQTNNTDDNEEYYVVPVIQSPYIHNDAGFCYDMTHECHENQQSLQELQQDHQDGLVSDVDRDRIYRGKTF